MTDTKFRVTFVDLGLKTKWKTLMYDAYTTRLSAPSLHPRRWSRARMGTAPSTSFCWPLLLFPHTLSTPGLAPAPAPLFAIPCWVVTILPSESSWTRWRRNRTWPECSLARCGSWRNVNNEQLNRFAMMTGSRNYATHSTDREMWLSFRRKLPMFVKFMLLVNIILCLFCLTINQFIGVEMGTVSK